MANRNVNGVTIGENGWPLVDEGSCQWITVPGTNVNLEIQVGVPLKVMSAFAADINAFVQPLRDADSACWTATNSVATSNHLGGTAMDLDWDDHPMGPEYAGWSPDQISRIRQLLDFYEDMIFWGEDWDTPKDSMHFQMGYGTFEDPAKCQDFINRRITADGFSSFGRTPIVVNPPPPPPTPPPPPPPSDAVAILAAATGLSTDLAASILPTLSSGLALAQCNTNNRIAAFIAETQEESADYDTTEEYASGAEYEGRADLGNTQPGDGVRFKGRTWIQVTGRSNYTAFSQWAFNNGLVPSPTQFVDNPTSLADMQWAGVGAAWYWTVQRPQINSLCDAGNITAVSEVINGGDNGLDVRIANWNRALAQGDALLSLLTSTGGDDFMSALTADEQQELLDLARQQASYQRESRSRLRWPSQGPVDTCAGFAWNADGFGHESQTEKLAVTYGDTLSIANLYAVANTQEAGRAADAELAMRILEKCDQGAVARAGIQMSQWIAAEAAFDAANPKIVPAS